MTDELVYIKVSDLVSQKKATSSDDGDIIFNMIDEAFDKGMKAVVDFTDIDLIISAFLNAAIGQLYAKYSSEFLRENLKVINMSNDDLGVLALVVERAKQYFAEKKDMDSPLDQKLEGE